MRAALGLLVICAMWVSRPVMAEEPFPGKDEFSKGMACYSELELHEALIHLKKSLAQLSPDKDPDYMQHLRTAKWIMVLIHLASDDLQSAEKELISLFELDPGFELPPGDHPPKVRYVFDRAREKALKKKTRLNKAKSTKEGNPEASAAKEPKSIQHPLSPGDKNIELGLSACVFLLFGDDADSVSSGPGMMLTFAYMIIPGLFATADFDYSYHPVYGGAPALQSAALHAGAQYYLLSQPIKINIGLSLGALGMGTQDRYDHWGLDMASSLSVSWPPFAAWALAMELRPSLVITSSNASFYLPISAGVEARW